MIVHVCPVPPTQKTRGRAHALLQGGHDTRRRNSPQQTVAAPQKAGSARGETPNLGKGEPQHPPSSPRSPPPYSAGAASAFPHLLVVVHDAQGGENPGAGRGDDVAVGKIHPLDDLGRRFLGGSAQLIVTD